MKWMRGTGCRWSGGWGKDGDTGFKDEGGDIVEPMDLVVNKSWLLTNYLLHNEAFCASITVPVKGYLIRYYFIGD